MRYIRLAFLFSYALVSNFLFAQSINIAKSVYGKSERIQVTYKDVPLPTNAARYIINITAKTSPYNGLDNYKYVREETSGVLDFNQMGFEGEYEVRLLKYKSSADTEPEVTARIPFAVGSLKIKEDKGTDDKKDNAEKKMKCNELVPITLNRAPAGGPTAKQITTIIRGILAERYAPLGKTGADVCVEFGPVIYLPKSTVKLFSDWNNPGQAALPAWPVKVRVKMKIPKGTEIEIKEAGTGNEVWKFYKDEKGSWNFKTGTT